MMPVEFISLGPGGTGTVTVTTLRMLSSCRVVYCFSTGGVSHAADIIRELCDEHLLPHMPDVRCVDVPMLRDRQSANAVYARLAEELAALYAEHDDGQDADETASSGICVVTEGDSGIFATTHYVMDRLLSCGIPCRQHPGVPSFIAAAAVAGLHIAKLRERLVVIPGNASADEMDDLLRSGHNIVIMKLSLATEAVRELLRRYDESAADATPTPFQTPSFHYFRNIGMPTQEYVRITSADMVPDRFPYFSLMIICR